MGARAFPQNLITEKGAFQLYDVKMGRGQLRGQLEPNAWAALAFLEGYRASHIDAYRSAAERVLTYARPNSSIPRAGAFVEDRDSSLALGANGIMADALIRVHCLTGRAEDLELATRVLAALGGAARALLVEDDDATIVARVADAVFYLRAYARVMEKP